MERLNNAHIEPGNQYDKYFPQPDWKDSVIKRSADLADTLDLIPKVVQQTKGDTVKISKLLKGKSKRETCSNIWHFVYRHIPYRRDEKGKEQIRRPARSWFERKQRKDGSKGGVDCDCYTVFISSVLGNLGIDHTLRVTKNTKDYFQHIYPIVPTGKGNYLTLDCVVDTFDYEAPFKEKIDKPMELHYLSGLDSDDLYDDEMLEEDEFMDDDLDEFGSSTYRLADDFEDEFDDTEEITEEPFYDEENDLLDYTINGFDFENLDGLSPEELGFLRKLRKKVSRGARRVGRTVSRTTRKVGRGVKKVAKKAIHVINKINPATLLLRNGLLLAMKLNMMKVASRLRWAYVSPSVARAKGIDSSKLSKLQSTRRRLEKIFYGAGGKPSNLRKAILTGKGNRDKAVQGLDGLGEVFDGGDYDENSSIREILGEELYYEEFAGPFNELEGFEGLQGELGAIATGTALAAASGAVTAISKLLDKIGTIENSTKKVVIRARSIPNRIVPKSSSVRRLISTRVPTTSRRSSSTTRARFVPSRSSSSSSRRIATSSRTTPTRVIRPTVVRRPPATTTPAVTRKALVPTPSTRSLPTPEPAAVAVTQAEPSGEKKGLVAWVKDNPSKTGLAAVGLVAVGYGVYQLAKKDSKKDNKSVNGLNGASKTGTKRRKKRTTPKKTTRKITNKRKSTSRKKTTSGKRKTTTRRSPKKTAIALM